jgi:hypothetical protein
VTKAALDKALKFIARGKLTFEERVVLHRVHVGRQARQNARGTLSARVE